MFFPENIWGIDPENIFLENNFQEKMFVCLKCFREKISRKKWLQKFSRKKVFRKTFSGIFFWKKLLGKIFQGKISWEDFLEKTVF